MVAVFEIKKEEYVHKTFRMSRRLMEELAKCASVYRISMYALVAQCCRYALDQMQTEEAAATEGHAIFRP